MMMVESPIGLYLQGEEETVCQKEICGASLQSGASDYAHLVAMRIGAVPLGMFMGKKNASELASWYPCNPRMANVCQKDVEYDSPLRRKNKATLVLRPFSAVLLLQRPIRIP
jgi:hypothetical protein